jgi:hypothetical protein
VSQSHIPPQSPSAPRSGASAAVDEPHGDSFLGSGNGSPCNQHSRHRYAAGCMSQACLPAAVVSYTPVCQHVEGALQTPRPAQRGIPEDARGLQCTPKLLSAASHQQNLRGSAQETLGYCSRNSITSDSLPFSHRQQQPSGGNSNNIASGMQATLDNLQSPDLRPLCCDASAGLTPCNQAGQATSSAQHACLGSSTQPDKPTCPDVVQKMQMDSTEKLLARSCHTSGIMLPGSQRATSREAPMQSTTDEVRVSNALQCA